MSGSWTKGSDQFFPCETGSVNYEWYREIAIWSCADTLELKKYGYNLADTAEKMFCMKILLILPKFHEKTLSRSGDIKIFLPGRKMYMYILSPPFMEEVLSEERQWNGWEYSRWYFSGWGFSRGKFPGGVLCLMDRNFPGGIFPRTIYDTKPRY